MSQPPISSGWRKPVFLARTPRFHTQVHDPEHDAEHEQAPRDRVLRRVAIGPRPDEEGAREGAEHREEGRCAEVVVVDRVASQHEDRDVDEGEDGEQEQGRRATQRRDAVRARPSWSPR